MVASGRRWIDWAVAQARPEHAPRIARALDRIGVAVGNYVGGALLQATIAGVTTFIVLTILGVPFAAPLAVVVGFFDLIPLVGATIAAVLVGARDGLPRLPDRDDRLGDLGDRLPADREHA